MEKERKFRFVGSEKEWITLTNGQVFSAGHVIMNGRTVLNYKDLYPEDWEEVTEPEMDYDKFFEAAKKYCTRIPNQDQPASSMTKFEMAVLGNVRTIVTMAEPIHELSSKVMVCDAIELAKETFKQLENLKK